MDPFLGELRVVGFNFAPRGWFPCDGRLLPISQYTALFAILGTTYGGNGQTTFAVPNMAGQASMGSGDGPGLTPRVLGESLGSTSVTLLSTEIPSHSHAITTVYQQANPADVMISTPSPDVYPSRLVVIGQTGAAYSNARLYNTPPPDQATTLSPQTLSVAGGSLPHENMQPYLTLKWCIAYEGIFPTRN